MPQRTAAKDHGLSLERFYELGHRDELDDPTLRDLWLIWGDELTASRPRGSRPDLVTDRLDTAGLPLPRLEEIHFPVGGRRFRPTVEELLLFIDRERLFNEQAPPLSSRRTASSASTPVRVATR